MTNLDRLCETVRPFAHEMQEASRLAPDGLNVESMFGNIGLFLSEHRHIPDAIVAAYDGEPIRVVQGRPILFVMERLVAIVWRELVPAHGTDAIIAAVQSLAGVKLVFQPPESVTLPDNVVPFAPRRER